LSAKKMEVPIYLVHNGSLGRHKSFLMSIFPDVHHIVLLKNQGFSGGANAGLAAVFEKHEWAIFLSNDCTIENFPRLPDAPALVAPKILVGASERVDSLLGTFNPPKAALRHVRSKSDLQHISKEKGWKQYAPGAAFAVHRKVWSAANGFDESLGSYWEDVDFSQRVLTAGYTVETNENWIIRHKRGATCHGLPLYTLYLFQRNRRIISWKYCDGVFERFLLIIVLVFSWFLLILRLLKGARYKDIKLLVRAILGYKYNYS